MKNGSISCTARRFAMALAVAVVVAGSPAASGSSVDARWERAVIEFGDALLLLDRSAEAQSVRLFDGHGVEQAGLRYSGRQAVLFSQVNGERIYFALPASAIPGPEWLATQSYLLWRDLGAQDGRNPRRERARVELQERGGYWRVAPSSEVEPPLALVAVEIELADGVLLGRRERMPILEPHNTAFAALTTRWYDKAGKRLGIARWFEQPRLFTWGIWGADGELRSAPVAPESLPDRPGLLWMADRLLESYYATPECTTFPCPTWPPGPGLPPSSGDDCKYSAGWCPAWCFECIGPFY